MFHDELNNIRVRDTYRFNETCQETVPQAIGAFLESTSFDDTIRNAISIGGDSDTLVAITGGIAEVYYGIPDDIRRLAESYLDPDLLKILHEFESQQHSQYRKSFILCVLFDTCPQNRKKFLLYIEEGSQRDAKENTFL